MFKVKESPLFFNAQAGAPAPAVNKPGRDVSFLTLKLEPFDCAQDRRQLLRLINPGEMSLY